MKVYNFHVYREATDRDATAVSILTLATEAEALETAWKMLKRSPEAAAIEVWSPSEMICRLGQARRSLHTYLGRWERLAYG